MACRSCRRQLNLLARQANTVAEIQHATTGRQQALLRQAAPRVVEQQRRGFRSTSSQPAPKIMQAIGNYFRRSTEPYRVLGVTQDIYKACAREAAYKMNLEQKKADTVPKTAEGEEIGEGATTWHKDFKLLPTFSTWSQVTMLHMYLIFARLRNLEPEMARSWQAQLVDHFFFDAEEKMDLYHGLTSRGLRHKYLKDLFIQWRGVIAAYDEGLVKSDAVLAAAVWRNVFKAREDVDVRMLAAIVSWMRLSLKMLDQMPDETLFFQAKPQTAFKWPAKNELLVVDIPTRELEKELRQTAPPVEKVAV